MLTGGKQMDTILLTETIKSKEPETGYSDVGKQKTNFDDDE